MSFVFKKPGSPYWYAGFRSQDGRRVHRSTKQRAHVKAVQIANQFERAAAKGLHGLLTEAQARTVLSEILEDTTGQPMNSHSCREWLTEWVAGKRGSVGSRSIEKYEQVTADFLEHLGDRADVPLTAINPRDIRGFRDALVKKGLIPDSVNQIVRKVLSSPFHAAQRFGHLPMNPCAAVEALKDDSDAQRETFTPAQVALLLDAAEDDWCGVILSAYHTGLRLRDVTELQWSSIDFDAELLRVKTRKTGARLAIPMHPELSAWLRKQPRGIARAPVFPTLSGRTTGGAHGLSSAFSAIMKKSGVQGRLVRGADGKGRKLYSLSFHSLRHSFVSALANQGVSPELRKVLSGHSDDRSHARYTHHDLDKLRAAVLSLPAVQ